MLKRFTTVTIALCAMTASTAHAGTEYPDAVRPESLGANVQFLTIGGNFGTAPSPDPALNQLAPLAQKMVDAGVQVVRLPVRWNYVEYTTDLFGNPNSPRWTMYDQIIQTLANKGLRVSALLGATPAWARANIGDEKYPPSSDSTFAAFANKIVARYGNNGTFWSTNAPGSADLPIKAWEIYNEPNIWGHFKHPLGFNCSQTLGTAQQPGPQRYATLFQAAYNTIHATDPNAIVMLGGLSGQIATVSPNCSVQEFIHAMQMHTGVVPDAIGLHIYTGETAGGVQTPRFDSTPPWAAASWDEILYRLRTYRWQIDQLGWSTRPIYLNENGWVRWPDGYDPDDWNQGPTTPDNVRGFYLAQVASKVLRSNCGVREYQPHTWRTAETLEQNGMANGEKYYGLAKANGDLWVPEWSDMMQRLRGNVAGDPPTTGYVDLCYWRGDVDVDGDGDLEVDDGTAIGDPDD